MSASNKSKKYLLLASDAITALKDVSDALEDGKLTPEEQAILIADVKRFQTDLKS